VLWWCRGGLTVVVDPESYSVWIWKVEGEIEQGLEVDTREG
jgi:hypothetical protein